MYLRLTYSTYTSAYYFDRNFLHKQSQINFILPRPYKRVRKYDMLYITEQQNMIFRKHSLYYEFQFAKAITRSVFGVE